MDRGVWWAPVFGGHKESDTTEWLNTLFVNSKEQSSFAHFGDTFWKQTTCFMYIKNVCPIIQNEVLQKEKGTYCGLMHLYGI